MAHVPNTNKFLNLGHNARLKKLLGLIESRVHTATSDTDLVEAISLLDTIPTPVQFQPSPVKQIARYGSYFFAVLAAILILAPAPRETVIMCFGMAIFCHMVSGISKENETDQLIHLAEKIHSKSRLFDYGLHTADEAKLPDFENFHRQFHILNFGSYNPKKQQLLSGDYKGSDLNFFYLYFHISYSSTSPSRGYIAADRCGFIIFSTHIKDLRISDLALKLFKPTWNSGSTEFNQRFAVKAADDMTTAKFLKPALLKEIDAAGNVLSYLDIDFNENGDLCFSFDDPHTLNGIRRTGLDDPEAFKQEIKEHNCMPHLDTALEFLHRLLKYSDNNFE